MNNFNNNWGYPMNYGYNNRPKVPNPTNPLSKEDMALLKQKAPQFSLAVSRVDELKAICTHRDETGARLIQNADGTVTCAICGTTFRPVTADPETVKQIFESAVNCLETIKIMYMDIPDEVTKAYFQMTPYLEKGPQLYKIANDHYQRYNNSSVVTGNYNNSGNAFALYSALINPGMMAGMGMPQQMYAQPGMAPQQPVPDVTMGVANGTNPFDAAASVPTPSPVNGVNPFDVASPTMANATQTVTDNKQYKL